MNIIEQMEKENMRHDIPDFRAGDTVRVHIRIVEGNKERTQLFQGIVIRRRRGTMDASVTVRKISHGVGVEKTFPLSSPRVEKIERVTQGRVRRSRLYYLRDLTGRSARIEDRETAQPKAEAPKAEAAKPETPKPEVSKIKKAEAPKAPNVSSAVAK